MTTAVRSRISRELLDLMRLFLAAAAAYAVCRLLAAHLPFRVWWPALIGVVLLTVLACRTAPGSTTVRTAARLALAHPVHAALVALVVLAPWAWDIVSALLVAGARLGVEAALGAMPAPSVHVPGAVTGWLAQLTGGAR